MIGCSNNANEKNQNVNTEEPADTNAPVENEGEDMMDAWISDDPVEVSMLVIDWGDHNENQVLWKKIKEMTNVTINTTPVPNTDFIAKAKLMLSTGEAPNFIPKVIQEDIAEFIPSGALLPVSDYLEFLPHYTERLEKWKLQEQVDNLKQLDGKYYILPGLKETPDPDRSIAIRTDLLKKYKLEMPQTYDELYEVLKKFKQENPGSIPWTDKFKGDQMLMLVAAAFGTQAGGDYNNGMAYDKENDNWYYAGADENYKSMIEYLAKLVDEGLLDQELFTQTGPEKFKKLAKGKSFVTTGAYDMLTRLHKNRPDDSATYDFMVAPGGPAGRISHVASPFQYGIVFPAKVQSEDNFEELLRFVDWLYFSDEGNTLTFWGVEGETYEIVDGKKKFLDHVKYGSFNPDAKYHIGKEWGTGSNNWRSGGSDEFYQSLMVEGNKEFYQKTKDSLKIQTPPPYVSMTDAQREQFTLVNATLKDYTNQMILKFILGDASIANDWDTYVKETERKGSKKLLDIYNEAWKATKEARK